MVLTLSALHSLNRTGLLAEAPVLEFLRLLHDHPGLAETLPPPLPLRSHRAASREGYTISPSFLQEQLPDPPTPGGLPEPPTPGGIVRKGSHLQLHCACASGFEVGASNTLPVDLPSVQSMNARCAATRVSIKMAPNPVRTISFTPPPNSLTVDEIGDVLLRLPFSRGVVHQVKEAGSSIGERTYLLADPQAIPWAKVTRHHFSEPEARTTRHVLGTPGGDLAELFFALQAAEHLALRFFPAARTQALLKAFLMYSPKLSFYHATDTAAVGRMAGAIGVGTLDLKKPPTATQTSLLSLLTEQAYTGSRFLRMLLSKCTERAGAVGPKHRVPRGQLRCGLLRDLITAFFSALWSESDEHNAQYARKKLRLVVWSDPPSEERAWLTVHTKRDCADYALAPLVTPRRADATIENADAKPLSAFVHHPQHVQIQRRETARLLAGELPRVDRVSLEEEYATLADMYLNDYQEIVAHDVAFYDIYIT